MAARNNQYQRADKAIRRLKEYAARRLEIAYTRMSDTHFDELNVIKEIKRLYADLDGRARKEYADLFCDQYLAIHDTDDAIDDLVAMEIAGLLETPSKVTHYAYETEVFRKRDRTTEAINSTVGGTKKEMELVKGVRYWNTMVGWYADLASDQATVDALKANGAEYVMWNAEDDSRTCDECEHRNGTIYPIGHIPPKPHPGCRCWITKATKEAYEKQHKSRGSS